MSHNVQTMSTMLKSSNWSKCPGRLWLGSTARHDSHSQDQLGWYWSSVLQPTDLLYYRVRLRGHKFWTMVDPPFLANHHHINSFTNLKLKGMATITNHLSSLDHSGHPQLPVCARRQGGQAEDAHHGQVRLFTTSKWPVIITIIIIGGPIGGRPSMVAPI